MDEARRRGRTLFAFLSYNFASTTSALSVLHSFIFQLASGDRDLETVVCGSSRDNLRSNLEVAVKIFSSLLDCAGPVYVTIDGVDEIDERERYLLLSQLLAVSETSEQLRLFVSSRPEADLKSCLLGKAEILRVETRNAGSIHTFVEQQCRKWVCEKPRFIASSRRSATSIGSFGF